MKIQHIKNKWITTSSIDQRIPTNHKNDYSTYSMTSNPVTINKEGLPKLVASLQFNNTSEDDPMLQYFQ